MVIDEVQKEFLDHVIPFWENLIDEDYGGYYGMLDFSLRLDKEAPKGCILNSRILWFFSNAYLTFKNDEYLKYADHAYRFLKEFCLDKEKEGVFWSLRYRGDVLDSTKHTYNQAFAIYALSSYYDATKNEEAKDLAFQLYHLIETKCRDDNGYLEAFTRDFQPESNEKLSENGVEATRTMNTLLHVFEAYTELYRVSNSPEVGNSIRYILDVFADKMYNPKLGRQEVFFDENYHSLIDLYSYGHDIETAWLIDRGLEILSDTSYTEKLTPITETLTAQVYKVAFDGCSIPTECCNGVLDESRAWWVQAEAMVGFYNGYQKHPENIHYLKTVKALWEYIKNHLIDKRVGSEWFWDVDGDGNPSSQRPIVEPWKCPYHAGRMCFELVRRNANV
ncbi:MAG: AGE family epimerase/isomerase [Lachnospiraceae bacterium]